MIFIAKNEKGIPTWKLTKEGKKTVTRRLKPLPVGKEFAIQPGRGKFAICRAKVISCMNSFKHWSEYSNGHADREYLTKEAKLEGFYTWNGLMAFFGKNKIQFKDTYRIEYKIIEKY